MQTQINLHKLIFNITLINLRSCKATKQQKKHFRKNTKTSLHCLKKFSVHSQENIFFLWHSSFTNQFICEIDPRASLVSDWNGGYLPDHSRKLPWTFNVILIKFCVDSACYAGLEITVSEIFACYWTESHFFSYIFKVNLEHHYTFQWILYIYLFVLEILILIKALSYYLRVY